MKSKRIFCLIIFFIIAVNFCVQPVSLSERDTLLNAEAATRGDYTYVVRDGQAYITSVAKTISGDVTIPSFFVGCDVVAIEASAFEDCVNMTSVVVPDCVTSIGLGAFKGCTSLRKITLPFIGGSTSDIDKRFLGYIFGASSYTLHSVPSSLKEVVVTKNSSLSEYSFYNCRGLTSITLPDNISTIGSNAFSGCTALANVYVKDIKLWCNISFENAYANPLSYGGTLNAGGTAVKTLNVPSEITKIKQYSFAGYEKLESVYFESSITQIDKGAFDGCSSLTSVTYNGKYSDWKKVTVATGNDELKKIVCKCLKQPYGDISGDDLVDGNDAVIMLKYFNGWDIDMECSYCSDINRDGSVNSLDLLLLTRYKNGWNVEIK